MLKIILMLIKIILYHYLITNNKIKITDFFEYQI